MKRTLLICLISQFAFCLFSQTQYADSLEIVLRTQKQELTPDEKMQLYWDILLCYWNTDLEKNISYATEALDYARKEKNHLWSSKFSRALGISYTFKKEADVALQYLNEAIKYAAAANDKREENAANMLIGNVYLTIGNKELALKYYTDALISLEEMEQYEVYTNTLYNIGSIHQELHNDQKALEYYKRGLETAEKHNITRSIAAINAAIGNFFSSQHQLDSAVTYVHKSYDIAQRIHEIPQIIISSQMLAGMYCDLKDYDKAKKYANECLEVAEQFGDKLKLVIAWTAKARVSLGLKNYKESEAYAYKAWVADSTNFSTAENAAAFVCLSNIHLGNSQKATYFFDKYKIIRDQLAAKSLHNSLVDMEVKYETEKKEMRIDTLEKEKQFYIWLTVAGAIALLMFLVVLFYRHRLYIQKRKMSQKEKEVAQEQIKQLEKEKQLIATQSVLDGETAERSRLARDLHDGLGGMLSVVKLNLEKGNYNKVTELLDESIEELRRVAHHIMPESLMYAGLKVSLEDFCCVIPNAHFQFIGEDTRLDRSLEVMLYRCAYELINNAVKYANASQINIQLAFHQSVIALSVDDNGIGFDPKEVVSGTGLKNIRTRVLAHNGVLTIRSAPGQGTEVIIEIESI